MNEETFNLQIRKFLKKVGVTSQREIEKAVRDAVASGALSGNEKVRASVTLKLPELGVELDIDETHRPRLTTALLRPRATRTGRRIKRRIEGLRS